MFHLSAILFSMNQPLFPSAFWDERYQSKEYFYGREPNDFLKDSEPLLNRNSKILLLAEGEGRNAVYLAEKGHICTAIDFSTKAKEKALELALQRNTSITYEIADLTCITLPPSTYDAVFAIWMHLPPNPMQWVSDQVWKTLCPNGKYFIEVYSKRQLSYETGGPRDLELLYDPTPSSLKTMAFQTHSLTERIRDVHEGPGHNGKSAVVQFIGCKSS